MRHSRIDPATAPCDERPACAEGVPVAEAQRRMAEGGPGGPPPAEEVRVAGQRTFPLSRPVTRPAPRER
jgi:hypothetical protein